MAYQVLALKYRPGTFKEVVGQKATVKTLENALREKRIAHGYIFSGVRGVGKTTMARIFSKALNCANGPTPEPCGECSSCIEIAEGRSLDVFEIDGASNRGVDRMAELLEAVRYTPARDRYKIFIIDEFHQITPHAFNALLKTLEEPPPHIVFIMATTEMGKVLPTIRSRCQQFDFRRIPSSEIIPHLRRVAGEEKIRIEEPTLRLLARSAGGSMRDAMTAMDQLVAACGDAPTEEDARSVLGVIPEEEVHAFLEGVAGRDAAVLLQLIARVADAGHDLVEFGAEIYRSARALLIARTLPDPAGILDLSADEAARATELAGRFGEDDLLRAVNLIEGVQASLRYSPQPRFVLEATAVRLARLADLAPVEEILERLEQASGTPAPPARARPDRSAPPRPSVTTRPLAQASDPKAKKKLPAERPPESDPPRPGEAPSAPAGELPAEAGLFERVLARLESERPGLAASLGMASGPREEDGLLLLPFAAGSTFRRRIEEAKNLALIESIASEIAGRTIRARVVSGETNPPRREPADGPVKKQEDAAARAMADPGVQTVMEVFRARVMDVEEKK